MLLIAQLFETTDIRTVDLIGIVHQISRIASNPVPVPFYPSAHGGITQTTSTHVVNFQSIACKKHGRKPTTIKPVSVLLDVLLDGERTRIATIRPPISPVCATTRHPSLSPLRRYARSQQWPRWKILKNMRREMDGKWKTDWKPMGEKLCKETMDSKKNLYAI